MNRITDAINSGAQLLESVTAPVGKFLTEVKGKATALAKNVCNCDRLQKWGSEQLSSLKKTSGKVVEFAGRQLKEASKLSNILAITTGASAITIVGMAIALLPAPVAAALGCLLLGTAAFAAGGWAMGKLAPYVENFGAALAGN